MIQVVIIFMGMNRKMTYCDCKDYQEDIDAYHDWIYCPWCGKKTKEEIEK